MAGNHSAVKVHIDHVVKKFNGRNGEMVALNGVDMDILKMSLSVLSALPAAVSPPCSILSADWRPLPRARFW